MPANDHNNVTTQLGILLLFSFSEPQHVVNLKTILTAVQGGPPCFPVLTTWDHEKTQWPPCITSYIILL